MGILPENNLHMDSVYAAKTMLESMAAHLIDPDAVSTGGLDCWHGRGRTAAAVDW